MDKLVEDVFDYVDSTFTLTSELSLSIEKAREIVREIVESVVAGYSSRPSAESVVKKIKKNAGVFSELIASKLLELDKLTPSQLEFAVTHGGKTVLSEAEKLYKLALRYGREDLIAALRHTWNTSGPRGLLECSRCGFNSITPDKVCLICGHAVTDDYIRESLSFEEKFEVYLKTASVAELNEALQFGYLLLGKRGVYSPRSRRARVENPVIYVVYLKQHELSRILEEVHSRELLI
ncbi:MAG: hypothetical protein QXL28_00080 [Desulfurococcaceae archaeon]